jgi:hypothetical protein
MEMKKNAKNAKNAKNILQQRGDHNKSDHNNRIASSANDDSYGNNAEMKKNAKNAKNILDETGHHNISRSSENTFTVPHHISIGNDTEMKNPQKTQKTYCCDICNFVTVNHFDHKRHLTTRKHINNTTIVEPQKKAEALYVCEVCDKSYVAYSGLWKHKKTCIAKEGNLENEIKPFNITAEMFMELMRQNKDLQELVKEDRKIIVELSKNSQGNFASNSHNTTTNSHNINSNTSFNLTFFLNEQCKNALNINEFVDSLNPTLQDMMRTGKVGYVEGVANIIINGLRELDVYSRPIHCTDIKREVLYVKDNDKWEKEAEDKPLLRKAVKRTANKNLKQIRVWEQQHPDYTDTDSQASEEHVALCQKLMGGISADENEKLENSIMKKIIKGVTIEKETLMVE